MPFLPRPIRIARLLWSHVFRRSPAFFGAMVLSSLAYAFSVVPLWLQKGYLEQIDKYLNGHTTLAAVIVSLLILYLVRSVTGGFLVPFGHARDLYYEYAITKNVSLSQHQIGNRVLLEYYQSAPMFNLMNRARIALTSGALRETVTSAGSSLTLVISLSALVGSLWLIEPLLALISLMSVMPVFFERLVFSAKFAAVQKQVAEKRRRQEQCVRHIVGKEFALETRISGAAGFLADSWEEYRKDIERQDMGFQVSRLKVELLLSLGKSTCAVAVIMLATLQVSQGSLTVGALTAVIGILGAMHGHTNFFVGMIGNLYSQCLELADVAQYYELEKQNESGGSVSALGEVRLQDASFRYPGRQEYAVRNVSKQFKPGEKIAILGVNGAGKTTLAYLLLGLFRPTEGAVWYGDREVSALDKPSLYPRMSAVFQDFGVYSLSVHDNVSFGKTRTPDEADRVYQALAKAGFDVHKLAGGVQTLVGREFNGVELSRGEAQQVALARVYYNRDAELVVIDEPTAALDPHAEERLYQEFLNIAGNKTTFMISHRLGSVQIADRILVMDNSEIREDGTHEQLLAQNGLYAQMYRAQAALYAR